MRKVCLKRPPKSVKFQEKDEIPLNYVPVRPAVKVARIAGALRHSRLETEPRCKLDYYQSYFEFASEKSLPVYFD